MIKKNNARFRDKDAPLNDRRESGKASIPTATPRKPTARNSLGG